LEGRWARLTLSAFAEKKLDYSRISRNISSSMFLERAVLQESYNQRMAQIFTTKTLAQAILTPEEPERVEAELVKLIRVVVPWVHVDDKAGIGPERSEVDRLLAAYQMLKEKKLIKCSE
jgi:hypothetical protein